VRGGVMEIGGVVLLLLIILVLFLVFR